jgi:hypothetical protein
MYLRPYIMLLVSSCFLHTTTRKPCPVGNEHKNVVELHPLLPTEKGVLRLYVRGCVRMYLHPYIMLLVSSCFLRTTTPKPCPVRNEHKNVLELHPLHPTEKGVLRLYVRGCVRMYLRPYIMLLVSSCFLHTTTPQPCPVRNEHRNVLELHPLHPTEKGVLRLYVRGCVRVYLRPYIMLLVSSCFLHTTTPK